MSLFLKTNNSGLQKLDRGFPLGVPMKFNFKFYKDILQEGAKEHG